MPEIKEENQRYIIVAAALAAILIAGALYADKVYVPPEAPPNIVYTIKGPVVLYDGAEPGDLITAPNLGTIYYLNEEKERVVFPDEQTYFTWYDDFSSLKHIPREVLESYPLSGRNATIRPGTKLITIPSSSQVWAVGSPNILYWMAGGEEQVREFFGEDWASRVVDLPEYYFANYREAGPLYGTDIYPVGFLIHSRSNNAYYLVVSGGLRQISEDGIKANRFQPQYAIEVDEPPDIQLAGPPVDDYEAKWSSPDLNEQMADTGPEDLDVGDAEAEVI